MEKILNFILEAIKTHGTMAMILGGLIEQIIVPIPSPIISMSGGAFLIDKDISFLESVGQVFSRVALPYSLGAVVGTSMVFLIAFFGGKPIIDKFGKIVGISWKMIEKMKKDFQKSIGDELFILISCSIPIVPVSLVAAFCGGFKIDPKKFYPLVFVALLIRATVLGMIGYQMGETFVGLAHGLNKIESLLTIVGALGILGFFYLKRKKWVKENE